jgi:aryl-alcohol dehydrogenase-like predicted oxidoreductase
MEYRTLGSTGWNVSAVGIGTWALGGSWGNVDDSESLQALQTAVDQGVNFFDTADVYGDGHSERLLALPDETMDAVRDAYDRHLREHVHHRW